MSAGLSSAFPTFLETTSSANESKTELQPFLKTTPIEPFLFTLSATTLLKSKTPDAVDTKVFISLFLSWGENLRLTTLEISTGAFDILMYVFISLVFA